jgi:hypothetical protein
MHQVAISSHTWRGHMAGKNHPHNCSAYRTNHSITNLGYGSRIDFGRQIQGESIGKRIDEEIWHRQRSEGHHNQTNQQHSYIIGCKYLILQIAQKMPQRGSTSKSHYICNSVRRRHLYEMGARLCRQPCNWKRTSTSRQTQLLRN